MPMTSYVRHFFSRVEKASFFFFFFLIICIPSHACIPFQKHREMKRKFYQHSFAPQEEFARCHFKAKQLLQLEEQKKKKEQAAAAADASPPTPELSATAAAASPPPPPPPSPSLQAATTTTTSSSSSSSTTPRLGLEPSALTLMADFERLGLASYQRKLRLVKQNELNLCLTYPLELLFPATMTDKVKKKKKKSIVLSSSLVTT
jgi:hypothetical protein